MSDKGGWERAIAEQALGTADAIGKIVRRVTALEKWVVLLNHNNQSLKQEIDDLRAGRDAGRDLDARGPTLDRDFDSEQIGEGA